MGFNLGYDLTRIAVDWKEGNKGEWSIIMEKYKDGNGNINYPHILITPIDSKKAIIKLVRPRKRKLKGKVPASEWKDAGEKIYFLDLSDIALGALQQIALAEDRLRQQKWSVQRSESTAEGRS